VYPCYTPLPDSAEYLMQKYGLTAEQAGDGSPDVVWLLEEGIGEAHLYDAGDRLDVGVEAFPGEKPNDMVLWIESHRTVIAGDTLVDFGNGLEINPRWLGPDGGSRSSRVCVRCSTCPWNTRSRPHGGPYDRAALERALS
jgi:glyoxylase-like metal-dependent hydrolase (beta-lactamase superfamily II)